jgi:hypothetical protein
MLMHAHKRFGVVLRQMGELLHALMAGEAGGSSSAAAAAEAEEKGPGDDGGTATAAEEPIDLS